MAPAGRHCGVTLLELLVTLAVIGLLGSLAYPSYREQLLRAHRSEAIEALLAAAAAQERHFLAQGRYAAGFDAADASGLPLPAITRGGRYRLQVQLPGPADYVITARPRPGSGQEADQRCSEWSVQADGRRSARDAQGADSSAACWG